jgi:hypothetical protein
MNEDFQLVIPPLTVRFFERGQHCENPKDTDIILVDHGTIASTLIEDAEKIATIREPALDGYTWCGHAGVIRTSDAIVPMISEMGFWGYERRPLESYRARLYAVVSFDIDDTQRRAAAQFDNAMSGADYGWFEYPAIIVDDATGLQLDASWSDHVICSTHVMMVQAAAGFLGTRLAVRTEPMRLAMWCGARR